ncbi:nucleolus and neural progenitor protein, partial [Silurus asotus]
MAAEPWNKVNIPYPCATATCRISFDTRTASVTEAVQVQCEGVLKLLDSYVLHTEIRVLREILYVLNNSLRQHKPFRAIKQVEQCIKRLKEMKLQGALQDLHELCPNQVQRTVGVDVGQCEVPSQPMLEWFCLKLLGGSSLLCRSMDQCTKAFLLVKQHLYLSEFIVLNVVLTSLLSRLWVFFQGILRALVHVYEVIKNLLRAVVQCRPMPFLTDFILPGDLTAFLGPTYFDLLKEMSTDVPFGIRKSTKPSLLNRLFEAGSEEKVGKGEEQEEREVIQMLTTEEETSDIDLGTAILRQGPTCLRNLNYVLRKKVDFLFGCSSCQYTAEVFTKTTSPGQQSSFSPAVLDQKRMFLKKLKTSSTIRDMTAHLEEMMGWCRRNKLRQERRFIAFTLLGCKRMNTLECDRIGVQKKLRRLAVRVSVLLKGTFSVRPSAFLQRRTKHYFRTRFPTLMRRHGSVRNRVGNVKAMRHDQVAKDLFNVTAKSSHKRRKYMKVSPLHKDVVSGNSDVCSPKESKMKASETSPVKSNRVHNDEIDNIFASFGL